MRSLFLKLKLREGFTLLELIVITGIIGILAAGLLAILNPFSQIQKAQDGRRKSDLSQVQKALEAYYQDHQAYPSNTASFQINGATWGSSWAPYMTVVPKDPSSSKKYVYSSNGQSYFLYASLDRGVKDPQACSNGTNCGNVPSGASC